MKKVLPILLGALGLASVAATPASAQIAGLTANAAVTTDYVFRGITQSAKRPAVSAGLDYAVPDTGLAIGTWFSSINFGDDTPMEWDVYANYNFMLGPVAASVGGIGYIYSYAGNGGPYTFFELDGTLSYTMGMVTLIGKANVAPGLPNGFLSVRNGYNPDSEFWLSGGASVAVAPWLALSGNVGYQGYGGNPPGINDGYVEWDIGATLTYDKYSLDLRYIDTSKHTFPSYTAPYFATGPFYVATFSFKFP